MLKIHLTKPVSNVKVSDISTLELPFFTLYVSTINNVLHVALYQMKNNIESFNILGKIKFPQSK